MNRTTLRTIKNLALLLWVALLPLQTRVFLHQGMLGGGPWDYGTLSLYASDILLLVALIAAMITEHRFWRRPKGLPIVVFGGAVAIVASVFLSAFNALDVGVALGVALRFIEGLVGAWLIVASEYSITTFAVAILSSAFFEAVLALVQFAQQSIPASTVFGLAAHSSSVSGDAVVETTLGRFLRSYGTLPHPNIVAGWLAFGLVVASGLYLRLKDALERAVVLAAFAVISAALFVTFSRAGLLGWLAVLILFTALVLFRERARSRRIWHFGFLERDLPVGLKMMKLVVASILLLGAFLWIFSPLVQGRATVVDRLEAKSVTERITQLSEAQKIIGKYWLAGVGVGNYTKAVHDVVDAGRQYWEYQPVHNVVVLMTAEVGVIGVLMMLWFVIALAVVGIKELRRRWSHHASQDLPWIAVFSLGLILLLPLGLVDHYLWSLPFGILFGWVVFGLWAKSVTHE